MNLSLFHRLACHVARGHIHTKALLGFYNPHLLEIPRMKYSLGYSNYVLFVINRYQQLTWATRRLWTMSLLAALSISWLLQHISLTVSIGVSTVGSADVIVQTREEEPSVVAGNVVNFTCQICGKVYSKKSKSKNHLWTMSFYTTSQVKNQSIFWNAVAYLWIYAWYIVFIGVFFF